MMFKRIGLLVAAATCAACLQAAVIEVTDLNNLSKLKPQPGDELVIPDGTYQDVKMVIKASGTKDKPVIVHARTAGKVYIEGKSCLRLSGEYVEVRGLCFRNGYAPQGGVIEYRTSSKEVANYCRVTDCAIDYFNPPMRDMANSWVLMYGRHNRFDHNSIVGKLNNNVTMAVILSEESSQQNFHSIDHNYFGYRPNLGSNGGETLRVGTSQDQFSSSNTRIENNFFEHCNGEVEVVSIKSSDNLISENVFYECAGVLALRHGNRNVVESNLFVGNNKPHTGGIRVINAGHKVYNNVFYQLAGDRFFAALGVMNAVPNSLPNRYHPVKDVDIAYNTFVDCAQILFGVGKDNERTQAPANVRFANNVVAAPAGSPLFTALSEIDGIRFENNVSATSIQGQQYSGFAADPAIKYYTLRGLSLPVSVAKAAPGFDYVVTDATSTPNSKKRGVGAIEPANAKKKDLDAITREKTGATWFVPVERNPLALSGRVIKVSPGLNTLQEAVAASQSGDVLQLEGGTNQTYVQLQPIVLRHYVVIRTHNGQEATLRYQGTARGAHITIAEGGSLDVSNLFFDGNVDEGYSAPISGINTAEGMSAHYYLRVDKCRFENYFETGFAAIRAYKDTFADSMLISRSIFRNMSAEGINLAGEKDDAGKYSVQQVVLSGCTFDNMLGSALNIYRGGNDESTSGPEVLVKDCQFNDVNNREQGAVLRLMGTQVATVQRCTFVNSGRGGASVRFDEMGWDKIRVADITLINSGKIHSFFGNIVMENIVVK